MACAQSVFPQGGAPLRCARFLYEGGSLKRVLFICSQNRLRSPTAEQVFSVYPGVECDSAGLNHNAENPVTPALLAWAELIFVMEKVHRRKLSAKFKRYITTQRIVCLDIPDEYEFMDPALVRLLHAKVTRFLPMRPIKPAPSQS